MTSCDNCSHFPVCNLREEYRQLLIDTEPFKKRNPAFQLEVNCKYFTVGYSGVVIRKDGNSYFNGHDGV